MLLNIDVFALPSQIGVLRADWGFVTELNIRIFHIVSF